MGVTNCQKTVRFFGQPSTYLFICKIFYLTRKGNGLVDFDGIWQEGLY